MVKPFPFEERHNDMPLLLVVLLLLAQPVLASGPLSFAESLVAEGDYYRAITEYKRFLHYHPDDPLAPQARLEIARSLLAGKRWEQADAALEKVWQDYPTSPAAKKARKLYADSAMERGSIDVAHQRYQLQLETTSSATDSAALNYQIGWSYLKENRIDEASQSFAKLDTPLADELQEALDNYRQLPRKSPRLAGVLSAALPGAGQLYTDRPRQAGVAFTLNAAFIYGAIEAWNNENYTVAGLLGLFEIGWYGGNIYNAMNNAHKINRQRDEAERERLRQRFGLSLGMHKDVPWLQARFKF